MFIRKVIAEKKEFNARGKKIINSIQQELEYLGTLSVAQLAKYEIRGRELETTLLKCKVFPHLEVMKNKPTYKDKLSRYDHTLNCLKGLLALAVGKKAEKMFVYFDKNLAGPGEQPISTEQYLTMVERGSHYLKDPEALLFLTTIILMHESGNIDNWNPRHFEESAFNAGLAMMELGFSKDWYDLGYFIIEEFVYFRELLTGDASLKLQQHFLPADTERFPEKYRDLNVLSLCCRFLTILDVNASGRIFLTDQRLEYIRMLELAQRENANKFYLKERFVLLREDLKGLQVEGFEAVYFRYLHTIVNAKNDDGSYLFSREQVENMLVAITKLEKEVSKDNKNHYKYMLLENMSLSALNELKERLFNVGKHIPDIKVSRAGTIYFLDYQIIFDGDYLIIYNR